MACHGPCSIKNRVFPVAYQANYSQDRQWSSHASPFPPHNLSRKVVARHLLIEVVSDGTASAPLECEDIENSIAEVPSFVRAKEQKQNPSSLVTWRVLCSSCLR